jgi:hypothetical protein
MGALKWGYVFPQDPDVCCQSEYRALHDCVRDAIDPDATSSDYDGDRELTAEDLGMIYSMLQEFVEWSDCIQRRIRELRQAPEVT